MIPTLFRLLEHDEPSVQAACAAVLDRTHSGAASPVSIPVLVEALASENSELRLHAARALRPLARNPRTAEAIPALLAILRKSVTGIERQGHRQPNTRLADPDPADETTELAIWLLIQVGPRTEFAGEIVAHLAESVRSEVPSLGQAAADASDGFLRPQSRHCSNC